MESRWTISMSDNPTTNWPNGVLSLKETKRRATVTIVVPPGYASAEEFCEDCGFERVENQNASE